ncbi:MAG TPA: hypothetical protein VGE74_05845 [Gemmata sp.]
MLNSIRIALMTHNQELLTDARKLALTEGHTVDALPPDAPEPEAGHFDGIIADLPRAARYALARQMFLDKLAKIAKRFPVLVLDRGLSYPEAAFLRAAGIRWLPSLRLQAFGVLLSHPLAQAAPRNEPELLVANEE